MALKERGHAVRDVGIRHHHIHAVDAASTWPRAQDSQRLSERSPLFV